MLPRPRWKSRADPRRLKSQLHLPRFDPAEVFRRHIGTHAFEAKSPRHGPEKLTDLSGSLTFADQEACARAVVAGAVDACLMDLPTALAVEQQVAGVDTIARFATDEPWAAALPDRASRANLEVLDACAARLRAGEALVLFPEGVSHAAPRLMPLRTGAARIALRRLHYPALLI